MITVLAIVLGFVLVSVAMRAADRLQVRRVATAKPLVRLSVRVD